MKLPVVITQDEDGFFLAEVPVLTSCYTQGKTKEEALANIKEVIPLCLEHMAEEGNLIPEEYVLEQAEVGLL
ncbi:MAG: type II toxin-antitoxin system HicB family antitoxin [Chloroflexi bacterium]|nr:type II toxin-antitoxin system HicB family antitoxin [Chloroflexota bacterium]